MSRPARVALAAVSLAGCAPTPDYVDHYTSTRATCGFARHRGASPTPGVDTPSYPSRACVDAVHQDFGVDADAFVRADQLDSAYGHVEGSPQARNTRHELILMNARALLTMDLGTLGDLRASPKLTREFLEELEAVSDATDTRDTAGLLYNFAASVITRTIPANRQGSRASYNADDETLRISSPVKDDTIVGTVLVHESRHRWGGHGVCPWNPEKSCDPDATGAYGFGMSAKVIVLRHTEDPDIVAELDQGIHKLTGMIASFNDDEGHRLPRFARSGPEPAP